jgi:hypothetical protein
MIEMLINVAFLVSGSHDPVFEHSSKLDAYFLLVTLPIRKLLRPEGIGLTRLDRPEVKCIGSELLMIARTLGSQERTSSL